MWITEIKRHLNRPVERYWCKLLHDEPGYRVIAYRADRDYSPGPARIPQGSLTLGHYWTDRGYVLWELYHPAGRLIGHWFHLCEAVRIERDVIEYLDLLLDLWRHPDGRFVELDRDEMDACKRAGKLSDRQAAWIEHWSQRIQHQAKEILEGLWKADERSSQSHSESEG